MNRLLILMTAVGVLIVAAGCGSAGTKPDDMTASQHRDHATAADRASREHLAKFKPNAKRLDPLSVYSDRTGGALEWSVESYNPTTYQGTLAERFARKAAAHRKAASVLETNESQACQAISRQVRSACPLRGPVNAWEKIPKGIRFYIRPGVPLAAVGAHLACHVAYGRATGKTTMPDCPLYVNGVAVIVDPKTRAVELTVPGGTDDVAELRRRAATHALLRGSAHAEHTHGAK